MGATIEGKGRVFAKDMGKWTSYTIGISSKDSDGNWINAYQPIRFKTGVTVENGTDIDYRAFPVAKEKTVDGKNRNYIIWQVLEFRIAGDDMGNAPEEPAESEEPAEQSGFAAFNPDDIPF